MRTFHRLALASLLLAACAAPDGDLVEPTADELALDAQKADAPYGAFKALPADSEWLYYDETQSLYLSDDAPIAYRHFQAQPGVEFKVGAYALDDAQAPLPGRGVGWKLQRAYKTKSGKYTWYVVAQADGSDGAATAVYTTTGYSDGLYLLTVGSAAKPEVITATLGCGSAQCSARVQPGGGCGGHTVTPRQCEGGLYCAYTLEAMCGFADAGGTCQKRPQFCNKLAGPPVCACNGTTYSNLCDVASAGTSVLRAGPCSANIVGDWEQIVGDQTHYDYTFNADGSFTSVYQPGCLFTTPHCAIKIAQSQGTYTIVDDGSKKTLTLTYTSDFHSPTQATFTINKKSLVGVDFGATALTLKRK